MNDLGVWLRGLRGSRTKTEVEERTGVLRATILHCERGDHVPLIRTLHALCDFYSADMEYAMVLRTEAQARRDRTHLKQRIAA